MTANPVELIGGLTSAANVPKADIISWAKARVTQVFANVTEIRNTSLAGQLVISIKTSGTQYYLDTTDTTTADDGVNCIISLDGKRFKPLASIIPATLVSLGGLFALNPVTDHFLTGLDTSGNLLHAQPSAANLSDGNTGTGAVVHTAGAAVSALTNLGIRSTGAAFDLKFATAEVLSATRALSWTVGNANRAISLSGDLTVNGTTTIAPGVSGQVGVWSGGTLSGSATPTLGASGTLGSVSFGNATSGVVTLQPVTGALGTVTLSLPAATDTLVGKATTDTLTNKTLTAPTINGGTHDGNTSLGIRSTGAAFDLKIATAEVLTASRTLSWVMGDAARTITLAGNVTLTGAFSTSGAFAQTLTATGATNVTLPTTGTLATVAGAEAFTNKTYNGNTWTVGTGVLTLGAGKTATVSNTLTFSGTDGSSVAFGAGGTVAYTANNLSAFAATTSAQLRSVLSDETGTGAAYFQGGDIGTPSAGVLTNATGLPIASGLSGLGTGVATFLATPSSANLAAATTDETGTGALVFASAPTLVNPVANTQSPSDNSTRLATTAYVDLQVAGGIAGVASFNGQTGIVISPVSGFVNKLRNSSMTSWFHGTSGTTTTSGGWAAEGVYVVPAGASVTWAKNANGLSSPRTVSSLLITGATSVTDVVARFVIESYDAAQLAGKQVTFQIPILNNTGGTITPTITVKRANAQDATYTNVDINAVSLQSITNGSTGILAYSWAANAACGNGLSINIDFGNNFSTVGKSIQIGGGFDVRVTPGVSTGLVTNPLEPEIPYATSDINWNKRFYRTSFANMTTAIPASTHDGIVMYASGGNGTSSGGSSIVWDVPMRANPSSLGTYDGAGNANKQSTRQSGAWADNQTGASNVAASANGFTFDVNFTAIVNAAMHYTADATLVGA